MAISTTTNKAEYTGNGTTVDFDLSIKVSDEDDVEVYLKEISTGTETLQTKTTDYTIAYISGSYDNGARVTFLTAPTSSYQIILIRVVDFTQELELVEGGDLSSEGLEDAFDRIVMQIQQLNERLLEIESV